MCKTGELISSLQTIQIPVQKSWTCCRLYLWKYFVKINVNLDNQLLGVMQDRDRYTIYIFIVDDLNWIHTIRMGISQRTRHNCVECGVRSGVLSLVTGTAALYTCDVSLISFQNSYTSRILMAYCFQNWDLNNLLIYIIGILRKIKPRSWIILYSTLILSECACL